MCFLEYSKLESHYLIKPLERAFEALSAKARTLPNSIVHSAYSQYFSLIFQGKSVSRMRSCQRFVDYKWHIGNEEYESKKCACVHG